jgi:hypothetical protein
MNHRNAAPAIEASADKCEGSHKQKEVPPHDAQRAGIFAKEEL